jgi:prevent-host-death family protein
MARRQVNVHEAKTHLSRLLEQVVQGDEVVIARDNVPLVKLVLVDSAKGVRKLGTAKGMIELGADFDAPLDDFAAYR